MSKTDPSSVVNYTWDIYGQLSSKSSGENYIFTGKRNLNTVTESNTVKELYTYDALGRRLKVQNADTTTLNFPLGNDTSYEVKKEGADTTVTKYISANGKYLAKTVKVNTNPEQKYFHHIDLVGSIRAITDATGAVTASYEYEPFGVTIKTTGSDEDNLGFAGKRLDAGSGLSYFGARYYDTDMGRFISRDPVQDGRNWYVYCSNNPLSYIDPNGLAVSREEWREDPLGNGGIGADDYWEDVDYLGYYDDSDISMSSVGSLAPILIPYIAANINPIINSVVDIFTSWGTFISTQYYNIVNAISSIGDKYWEYDEIYNNNLDKTGRKGTNKISDHGIEPDKQPKKKPKKVNDKNFAKETGMDAESFKKEIVGNAGGEYDIFKDSSGNYWLQRKGSNIFIDAHFKYSGFPTN